MIDSAKRDSPCLSAVCRRFYTVGSWTNDLDWIQRCCQRYCGHRLVSQRTVCVRLHTALRYAPSFRASFQSVPRFITLFLPWCSRVTRSKHGIPVMILLLFCLLLFHRLFVGRFKGFTLRGSINISHIKHDLRDRGYFIECIKQDTLGYLFQIYEKRNWTEEHIKLPLALPLINVEDTVYLKSNCKQ